MKTNEDDQSLCLPKILGPPVWTLEKLIFSSSDYYESLLDAIKRAHSTIELESYIFAPDDLGLRILDLLALKIKQGVKVRLIIDGVGSRAWSSEDLAHWRERGIEIRVFHPIFWSISPKLVYLIFSQFNHRDHRKISIIDGRRAFVSSFNIMRASYNWEEMGVQVEGSPVETLQRTFEIMWHKSYPRSNPLLRFRPIKGIDQLSTAWVQFNFTKSLRKKLNKETCDRISAAKERVWVITPYFVPPLTLIKSLKDAKTNGADVRLILPYKSDIPFMPWVALYFTKILLAAEIKVYHYTAQMLHAKFLLIDDWLSIGSMNLNHRSFYLDVETNVILAKKETIAQAVRKFESLLNESTLVNEADTKVKNPILDLWIHFILLMRGWL